mgnify:CR=1 FL=1
MKITEKIDLLKIGVFLIGISMFIFSIIALHMYITQQHKYEMPDFYVNCLKDTNGFSITIGTFSADIKEVKVMYDNKTVCEFAKISSRSEELCKVHEEGIYTVTAMINSKEIKKIAYCRNYSYGVFLD